jgi:hypothetical protein
LVNPKLVNDVSGLAFCFIFLISGIIPIPNLIVENATVLSPVYHARRLIFWSANISLPIDNHPYPSLHLIWLLWAIFVFIPFAVWAYQRDSVIE